MEKRERLGSRTEAIRRRNVLELVDCIVYRKDPELSYLCILLHDDELGPLTRTALVNVITSEKTGHGSEFAFRLLRDNKSALTQELRDALFGNIVDAADMTTCSLTLQFVPNLGDWEAKLRAVLAG